MTRGSDVRPLHAAGWSDQVGVLRDVARFNLCLATPSLPCRWAGPLGWPDAGPALPPAIRDGAAARAAVSAALAACLHHPPTFDPLRPEWPLALLPVPALDDLCRHLAAVWMHRRVRQALAQVEVLRWRRWLGPAAWQLAMEGAALLPAMPPAPAVEPDHAPATALGRAWLWQASLHWDPAITERWRLRHDPPDPAWALDVPPERAHRTAMAVLQAVQPRWFSRFVR